MEGIALRRYALDDRSMTMSGTSLRPAVPSWLQDFSLTAFFSSCSCSDSSRTNFFCIDCSRAMCSQCRHIHPIDHQSPILQIRRNTYRDSILIADVTAHFDVTGIQPYKINHSYVVFLRNKEESSTKASCRGCESCGKGSMMSRARFCSILCKIHWITRTGDRTMSMSPCLVPIHPPSLSRTKIQPSTACDASKKKPAVKRPRPEPEAPGTPRQCRRKGVPHRAPGF